MKEVTIDPDVDEIITSQFKNNIPGRLSLAEVRKNSRILAQAERDKNCVLFKFPVELSIKIAALTGSLQDYNKEKLEKIAYEHFERPAPIISIKTGYKLQKNINICY